MTIQEFKKHWKDVLAGAVIVAGLTTICGVLLVDTGATEKASATQQVTTPAVSPAKALVKKPEGSPSPKPSVTPAGDTITYVAHGAPAMVSYGVNADTKGDVPMKVTKPFDMKIDDAYSIVAIQTDPGETGTTIIKILINGKVMAHISASSEHKTAAIMLSKNSMTGKWVAIPSTS